MSYSAAMSILLNLSYKVSGYRLAVFVEDQCSELLESGMDDET